MIPVGPTTESWKWDLQTIPVRMIPADNHAVDFVAAALQFAAGREPCPPEPGRLMQDCAAQIIEGVRILAHILKPQRILIGIEDNKPATPN